MKMNLFDLHCDTAGELFKQNKSLLKNNLHIDLCKGEKLDKWSQLFAIWIPDNLRGDSAKEYFCNVYENFKAEIKLNEDKIVLCQGISDSDEAHKNGKAAAFITCEGGSPFADSEGADRAKTLGVKLITLTWNGENELGYGCQSGIADGLKPSGKILLRGMARNKIAADVSHLNKRGFYDALESGAKVIASHSNSEKVLLDTRKDGEDKFFSCRRSLDDEQIKLLIEAKGLIGINFCKSFLGDEGDDGLEAMLRHINHILDLGGEDVLSIGSDYDGCDVNPELCGIEKIPLIRDYLDRRGLKKEILGKIFYDNAYNFFKNILQD